MNLNYFKSLATNAAQSFTQLKDYASSFTVIKNDKEFFKDTTGTDMTDQQVKDKLTS